MAVSFETVLNRMDSAAGQGQTDTSGVLRTLDPKQRKALELFQLFETIAAHQVGALFGFKQRTSAQLCKDWVEDGFLEVVDASNKGRKYKLAKRYAALVSFPTN